MKSMTIQIEFFNDPNLPEKYLAYINSEDHRGMVVSGKDVPEVLREMATSIFVLESYNKKGILE